jgi:hypothetical protein
MTAEEIIVRALKSIKAIGEGETASTETLADGLQHLTNIIALLGMQRAYVPFTVSDSYALPASTSSFTFGTGGTLNTARPNRIESAWIRDSQNVDTPLDIIHEDRYWRIEDKTVAGRPEKLFCKQEFPLAVVYLSPVPDVSTYTLYLNSWKPSVPPTALSSSAVFPDECLVALEWNLCLALAPMHGAALDEATAALATEGRAAMKKLYGQPVDTSLADSALMWRPTR